MVGPLGSTPVGMHYRDITAFITKRKKGAGRDLIHLCGGTEGNIKFHFLSTFSFSSLPFLCSSPRLPLPFPHTLHLSTQACVRVRLCIRLQPFDSCPSHQTQ